MLIRQNGPVFGSSSPYSQAGETQLTISARALVSNDHYNGTEEQVQRHTLDTYEPSADARCQRDTRVQRTLFDERQHAVHQLILGDPESDVGRAGGAR